MKSHDTRTKMELGAPRERMFEWWIGLALFGKLGLLLAITAAFFGVVAAGLYLYLPQTRPKTAAEINASMDSEIRKREEKERWRRIELQRQQLLQQQREEKKRQREEVKRWRLQKNRLVVHSRSRDNRIALELTRQISMVTSKWEQFVDTLDLTSATGVRPGAAECFNASVNKKTVRMYQKWQRYARNIRDRRKRHKMQRLLKGAVSKCLHCHKDYKALCAEAKLQLKFF